MTYTIEKVTTLIGAHRFGTADANIGFLLTDSRSLCFAEETLFFALKSGRNDGHNYISDLYRRGVRNFVVEDVPADYNTTYADANFLKVENSLVALQRLAERHREEYDIPIVGITGSNGKTIVKEWLYQSLSPEMKVTRSPRSYNSQIGVPLSVWLLNEQSQVGVFEAGISEPGEMPGSARHHTARHRRAHVHRRRPSEELLVVGGEVPREGGALPRHKDHRLLQGRRGGRPRGAQRRLQGARTSRGRCATVRLRSSWRAWRRKDSHPLYIIYITTRQASMCCRSSTRRRCATP